MLSDSSVILSKLGYDYYSIKEPSVRPDVVSTKFSDIIPELANAHEDWITQLASQNLYSHQLESLKWLEEGFNLILKAGTGSGKTEAWVFYALKHGKRVLAVYPTLALASDQTRRISSYYDVKRKKMLMLDANTAKDLVATKGLSRARAEVGLSDAILTNPAFLLNELKKWGRGSQSLLSSFLIGLDMLVLDEVDFYGPRELAILFSMVKLLCMMSENKLQVVVLTAGLENPEDLADVLKGFTERKCKVIEGKPFRVESRTYVVLGKNLKRVWEEAKRYKDQLSKAGRDVAGALEDFEKFRQCYYKVLSVAESFNIDLKADSSDPLEVLANYSNDEGVTLIFTKGITKAEELYRRARNDDNLGKVSASHHHLIDKRKRREVEEGARSGKVKLIFTPRTLSQGIDIGTVVRTVHVGLPESLREFYQKEGRKGRRLNIPFAETLIFPSGRWDRDLLNRGIGALRSWLSLPKEKTVFIPSNKYATFFEALFKFNSSKLKAFITSEERELLEKLGLSKEGMLTNRGKRAWNRMNFYEFSPPYGIKRIVYDGKEAQYLEEVSHCDLVEKFQPGCIDYSSDGIVIDHRLVEGSKEVTAVVEEKISERTLYSREALARAYEEYQRWKERWGDHADFFSDYLHGKVHSEVFCAVTVPSQGFGRLVKIPARVVWRVVGKGYDVREIEGKTVVIKKTASVQVPTPTYGRYTDYTYGFALDLDPAEDIRWIRIGLAYLAIVLRRVFRIPLETIGYTVENLGGRKFMILHEVESSGIIESMDWLSVKRALESYNVDELDEYLMEAVDEVAYADFLSYGLRWDLAKFFAIRAIEYMLLRFRVRTYVAGKEISLPKPSRGLKISTLEALEVGMGDDQPKVCYICLYDGEDYVFDYSIKDFETVRGGRKVEDFMSRLVNEGFKIVTYSKQAIEGSSGSMPRSLKLILKGLESEGKYIEIVSELKKKLGQDVLPIQEVEGSLGLEVTKRIEDLWVKSEDLKRRYVGKELAKVDKFAYYLAEKAEEYLKERVKNVYIIWNALPHI